MIDIFNKARTPWNEVDDETKAEIKRQVEVGASIEEYSRFSGIWNDTGTEIADCIARIYRIKPGTEIPPLPDTVSLETLENNRKPLWALREDEPEVYAALIAHGGPYEVRLARGWVDVGRTSADAFRNPAEHPIRSFRVKANPAPNLIEREGNTPCCKCRSDLRLWSALVAADTLIQTMTGGDEKLLAAYKEAVK